MFNKVQNCHCERKRSNLTSLISADCFGTSCLVRCTAERYRRFFSRNVINKIHNRHLKFFDFLFILCTGIPVSPVAGFYPAKYPVKPSYSGRHFLYNSECHRGIIMDSFQ